MKPLTVMAWDTATPWCSAALIKTSENGFELLAEFKSDDGRHSRILPPQVKSMLGDNGLTPADLDLLAVGRGPGSFTGLRTGLALAKGLTLGASIPLMGISSLEIMAAEMFWGRGKQAEPALAAPVIDARHQEIFTALYQAKEELELECLIPPQPLPPDQLAACLAKTAPEQNIQIAGPALALTRQAADWPPLLSAGSDGIIPSAVMLARLAAHRFHSDQALAQNPPLPLYIRQPDIRPSGIAMR